MRNIIPFLICLLLTSSFAFVKMEKNHPFYLIKINLIKNEQKYLIGVAELSILYLIVTKPNIYFEMSSSLGRKWTLSCLLH